MISVHYVNFSGRAGRVCQHVRLQESTQSRDVQVTDNDALGLSIRTDDRRRHDPYQPKLGRLNRLRGLEVETRAELRGGAHRLNVGAGPEGSYHESTRLHHFNRIEGQTRRSRPLHSA